MLQDYFEKNEGNLIDKWHHYFDIYDFWFKKYRDKPVVILEIGVFQGGSLQMWRDYFGKNALIYGVDLNPLCKQFEGENTKIFIGSQEDKNFLEKVKAEIPKIDILIDDGGHTMRQQIITFEIMYGHIKEEGIYLCEDLHTSYWKIYGGGYKNKESFIEYSKNFIDKINAWHSRDSNLEVDNFTRSTYGLHFYDSILLIEKKVINKPTYEKRGNIIIPFHEFKSYHKKKNIINRLLKRLNKIFKFYFYK